METLAAIEQRWGCRKFTEQPIEREVLGTILDAGRLAPSAGNLQDRSFIVIKNQETRSDLAKAAGNQSWMQTAPVHIIVVAEHKKNGKFFGDKGDKFYAIQDTSFAVENMLLAAIDLGLGCSLVVGFNEEKIIELLGIQTPAKPHAIIVIGHAAEAPKPSAKYPLEKFVFFEKYGQKAEMEVAFGDFRAVKKQITLKTIQGTQEIKKRTASFLEKIKSLFKKKKQEAPAEEHFLETGISAEEEKEIPRQLPRRL